MDSTSQPTQGGPRPHAVPHVAVGALVVAAAACQVAVHYAGDEQVVATWVAGTAFVIGVVAATRVRRRVLDKKARRRALQFIAVAGGWLTTVTLTGLSWGAVGVLMAVGYALSMHWWRQHPVGLIQPKVSRSEYQRLWAENVGCSDGVLAGSRLSNPEQIAAGIRYALRLRPGKQHVGMVVDKMKTVRGGLKLRPDQQLIVEAHPTEPEPTALLTIVTNSPVKAGVLWPGPSAFDPETGRVQLGPYADGEGTATWRAYTDNRLWGGFIQGGTGSGKSRLIDSLAMSLAASTTHPTVIFYADGQGGASSPLLMRHADLFAGTFERIFAMVEAMHMVMLLRQRENVEHGWEGFTPTADRPGLLGIIDECHKPLLEAENPEYWKRTQQLAATISREGGKVGVALILASQEPTLNAFGGAGSRYCEALRSSLLTGNGIMLAGDDPNARVIFGVKENPKEFPVGGGYGLVAKPAPGARQALFRSTYLDDQAKAKWPGRFVWRSFDGTSAGAAMKGYGERERTFADRKAVKDGMPVGFVGLAQPVPAQRQPEPQPATGGDGAALEAFGAVAFPPAWPAFVASMQAEARKELGPSHAKVLDAIAAGHTSPARIADHIGLGVRQVHNLLGTLVEAGRVRGGGRQYEVAA
ncbi:hypothetical protein O7598_31100 [Micromonospora sp. WMMC241]|uniref:hypothetical protein n=1 Tax=Micromonospora sp. WMMC241 TaxID=3015159 RepID=UPI0022B71FD4|nr:hypothetical protein [Micromonospora sp. WMMC241]MCZ7440800.1 hypothetical protein [Micromonospora sp. WMMC241]MCZ7440873.1 hypothetical protein [Micromonospora sp. WMMC241]